MRLKSECLTGLVVAIALGLSVACTSVEILNQPAPTATDGEPDPDTTDPPAEDPAPLDIAGAWDTWAAEQSDTCGFDPPEPYAPILIEEDASGVIVTVLDADGACVETERTREGDTVTLTRSDVLDLNGAFVRVDLNIVYEFDDDGFAGTLTQSFTDLSGVFSDLPCEVTLAISGSRCNGCWAGCAATQGTASSPLAAGLDLNDARFEIGEN